MNCAWQAYLNILPQWIRNDVDKLGRDSLQELRLRLMYPPELVVKGGQIWLDRTVKDNDLTSVLNAASAFSPWTAETIRRGYITAPGGHRVGICGRVSVVNGEIRSLSRLTSVSIRVARDYSKISPRFVDMKGSTLIIGSPGTGKTTILRDIIRQISAESNCHVAVVDEREEIFPLENGMFSFPTGGCTDVLCGCGKKTGIEMVLRSMNPQVIAVDEITTESDCNALAYAGWCGVSLLATAHAANRQDLFTRVVYKPLLQKGLFQNLIILRKDQSWQLERMYG